MADKRDLRSSELYINRELSWLEFNGRVLEEAQDKSNPLGERLKFLSICSSNLDEFFMVRVSGLMALSGIGSSGQDPAGMTPEEQQAAISLKTHKMVYDQYNCFLRSVCRGLALEGLSFLDMSGLTENEKVTAERYFNTTLSPILTPMAIDQSRPFPFLSNRSLNIILELEKKGESRRYAVVQVPSVVPRLFEIGAGRFILIEEIVKAFSHRLFMGNRVVCSYCFRITRDSDLEMHEEET
ncbi:MAG: RNA degradosome polyphosphate kinase, partial [Clostridiales bacterium]|nr:RNA degradosome polyphosphate kinase [Clostridiales bacterium]